MSACIRSTAYQHPPQAQTNVNLVLAVSSCHTFRRSYVSIRMYQYSHEPAEAGDPVSITL